jgi:S1-C subfamily serine protease
MTPSQTAPCPSCRHEVQVVKQRVGERIVCPKCYRTATLTVMGSGDKQRLMLLSNDNARGVRPAPVLPARNTAQPPVSGSAAQAPSRGPGGHEPKPAPEHVAASPVKPPAAPAAPPPSPVRRSAGASTGSKGPWLVVSLVLGVGALAAAIVIALVIRGSSLSRNHDASADAATQGNTAPSSTTDLPTKEVVRLCEPAVCHIKTSMGTGTGFVVGPQLIATNEHVVGLADPNKISIAFPAQHNATYDHVSVAFAVLKTDLLLLSVPSLPSTYTSLQTIKLKDLAKGDKLIVIGNPKGMDNTVTEGIYGSVQQLNNVDFLQLSVPVNPGNSGGPALTARGAVAGVVTLKRSDAEGIGFAIPGDVLQQALQDLRSFAPADAQKNVQAWMAKQAATKLWSGCGIAVVLLTKPLDARVRSKVLDLFDNISHDSQTRLDQLRRGGLGRADLDDVEKLADCYHKLSQQARSPKLSEAVITAVIREARGLHDGLETRLGSMGGTDPQSFVNMVTSP